jgi:hypothetical protein
MARHFKILSYDILYMTTIDDLFLSVNVSGLPFTNQTYNFSNFNNGGAICNTNTTNLTSIKVHQSQTSFIDYAQPPIVTFSKSQVNCDIKIDLLRVSDNKIPNLDVELPNMIFHFDIYGVDATNSDTRLKY